MDMLWTDQVNEWESIQFTYHVMCDKGPEFYGDADCSLQAHNVVDLYNLKGSAHGRFFAKGGNQFSP